MAAKRGRPPKAKAATTPPPAPRGKRCATEGCGHHVKAGYRYCAYHGGKILEALHKSPEWLTSDVQWNPETRARHISLAVD